MLEDKFKPGDKVRRRVTSQILNGWPMGGETLTVEDSYEGSIHLKEDKEPCRKWSQAHFELVEKSSWTPKYAIGDQIMPACMKDWQSPVTITGIDCKFIYRTNKTHLDNVPEEKIKPFVQRLRTVFIDGVLYQEVTKPNPLLF